MRIDGRGGLASAAAFRASFRESIVRCGLVPVRRGVRLGIRLGRHLRHLLFALDPVFVGGRLAVAATPSATTAPSAPAAPGTFAIALVNALAITVALAVIGRTSGDFPSFLIGSDQRGFDFFFLFDLVLVVIVVDRNDECLQPLRGDRARAGAFNAHSRALEALVDQDLDRDAIALLDFAQFDAFLVEQVDRGLAPGAQLDLVAAATCGLVLDHPQCRQAGRRGGAHQARALAMRARLGRGFEHPGA